MHIQAISITADDGGRSQSVTISGTSAQSADILVPYVIVTLTVPAFIRQGSNPTATADGTDIYLLADVTYRINVQQGNKLAFKTAGASGTAYITPGA